MPKLHSTELGDCDELTCRRAGCRRLVATNGSGWVLPFCAADLRKLSRKTFDALVAVAGRCVFDIDAVAEAAALVAHARLELRGKLVKRG